MQNIESELVHINQIGTASAHETFADLQMSRRRKIPALLQLEGQILAERMPRGKQRYSENGKFSSAPIETITNNAKKIDNILC
jgi:hypothetical protein